MWLQGNPEGFQGGATRIEQALTLPLQINLALASAIHCAC